MTDTLFPAVREAVRTGFGLEVFTHALAVPDTWPPKAWSHDRAFWTVEAKMLVNAYGLRNRFAIITETPGQPTFERRTYAQYAYAVALLYIKLGISPWIGIVVAAAVGALAGVIIGYPTFRLRGHYFALAMLAYPLVLLYLFQWLGYQEVTLPMVREAATTYMQFADQRVYVVLAVLLLLVTLLVNLRMDRARFGLALRAINELAWSFRSHSRPPLRTRLLRANA